jgi:hypothetical protein
LEGIINLIARIFEFLLRKIKFKSRKWAIKAIEKLDLTNISIKKIKERRVFWRVFFLSIFIRLAKYGSLFFLLHSILLSHGFTFKDLNFLKLILGVTGAEFSSVLPIKGIAGFGTWESAWALSFRLMGFDPNLAIISGLAVHLITQVFEYLLGILSIIILILPIIKRRKKN